jgi:hypothetical protein
MVGSVEVIGGREICGRGPLGVTTYLACVVARTSFAARWQCDFNCFTGSCLYFSLLLRAFFSFEALREYRLCWVTRLLREKPRRSHDEYRRALQSKSPEIMISFES